MVDPLRSIIINNTDSRITYEPAKAWTDVSSLDTEFQTAGNLGSPFSSSLKTIFQNGSFSFSFNGSSILAYDSSDIINGTQPTLDCTIDGMVITPRVTEFPQNNWIFCSSGNLDVGQHELVVSVQSQGSLFFFDYVTFVPASDDQLNDALIRINSADSSINYYGNWTSEAMTDAAQLTNDNGSFVTLSFIGQQLTWYGSFSTLFPFAPALAEFSVDGGSPTQFELAGLVDKGLFTASSLHQLLFQTEKLSQGPHEITVTYLGNGQQTDLNLDYAIIQNSSETLAANIASNSTTISSITNDFTPTKNPLIPSTTLTPPNISTPLSAQSSTSSPTTTIIHSSSDSPTPTVIKPTPSNTTISTQSHRSNIPIIGIGIVAGVILLLVLIALAVIFVYKRRRRRNAKIMAESSVKIKTSENTTPTLPLTTVPAFSDGGGDNFVFLRRQRTMRTATSDSLDGYETPSIISPRTSDMSPTDSMEGLLSNMQRAHAATFQVPSLPTLLDPFVFDTESLSSVDTRRISNLSSALVHNSNPHSIRVVRQLPHLPLAADVNQMTRGAESVSSVGPSVFQAERDSGIRLGKDQVFHYQESSSLKGTPPTYTRI